MFSFLPKEEKFFSMFKEIAVNILDGARLLKDMLDNFDDPIESQKKIKDIEHKGDLMTHEIIRKLHKSFITPFDREDIYALASALDDILDLIDSSAQHITIYQVDHITVEAKALGFFILQACQTIDKAMSVLGNKSEHIAEYCVEIKSLENEADKVFRDAKRNLFQNEKDPIELIKWKEVYETLELAIDKCEDAANILESVVLKNG